MRQFSLDEIIKLILKSRPIYGQDSLCCDEHDNEIPKSGTRQHFTDQCALDNWFPSLVLAWLSLTVVCIMTLMFIIQPFLMHITPFNPQYIFLYAIMIAFCVLYIILLRLTKNNKSMLIKLELSLLAFTGLWSAAFSAIDIINGYTSYLFIQITIIQALMYRGGSRLRCVFNITGFGLYLAILLKSGIEGSVLIAEIVNPFFMSVVGCAIILINDRIQFKSFKNRELIRQQHELLKYYADNDYLTNIPNRKNIIDYLNSMLKGSDTIACMMIDIDNFKLYNDIHGHIKGDDCLVRLAKLMYDLVTAKGGHFGRYGGEEFLAVFGGAEDNDCLCVARKIVDAVENEHIELGGPAFEYVTISIGVSMSNTGSVCSRDLIKNADSAMYEAKKQGKNRALLYQNMINSDVYWRFYNRN